MSAVFERIVLVLGVCLPVPLLAATGLSIPMPATVERLAASLVPFAEAATLKANEAPARVSRGVIVRQPGEKAPGGVAREAVRRSGGTARLRSGPKSVPRRKPGVGGKRPPARPTVGKVPVTPKTSVETPSEAPAEAGASDPQPGQPQPAPQPQPQPQPEPQPQPKPQPQPQPQPQPTPEPLPLPIPLPPPPPPSPLPVEVPKLPLPGLGR